MMGKVEIAGVLREIASVLQLKGENAFKVRAYDRAAQTLEEEIDDLGALIEAGRLTELRGIGKSLSEKITELYYTEHLAYLDQLHGEIPPGVIEMARVPEIGPKRALLLLRALDVTNLAELIDACEARQVRKVHGLGARTEVNMLEAARHRLGEPEPSDEHHHSAWRPDRIPQAQFDLPLEPRSR
jgi:DNA polymerase (family 10)